jgi:hypothetical protein
MIHDVIERKFDWNRCAKGFPQMEMHNGLKPVIIFGVVLHTSSVKASW